MKTIEQFAENILKPYIDDEDNKFAANIAPVEEDATSASQGYAVGQQLILDGVLYDVTAAITAGDALATTGAGANISAADDVTTQIEATNTELSSVKQALTDLEENLTEKVASGDAYTFRQGKGSLVDMSLVGGTVAMNQILNITSTDLPSGITTSVDADGYLNITGTAQENANMTLYPAPTGLANHVLFYHTSNYNNFSWGRLGFPYKTTASFISKHNVDFTAGIRIGIVNGTTYNIKTKFMCIDLTQLLGSTIADYIYSLEQATEGAGVAFFRKLFPKDYYAYDTGSLQSVKPSGRKVAGFNLWDEQYESGYISGINGSLVADANSIRSKNYNSCLPNTTYYFRKPSSYSVDPSVAWYDANKNFISRSSSIPFVTSPSNARYFKLSMYNYGTAYNNDLCLNISKTTGSPKNGDYEPYCGMVYPFPSIDLRGVPKLVDNKLAYDGDIYKADGSISRKYGIVDLGTLTWRYESANPTDFFVLNFDSNKAKYWGNLICSKYQGGQYTYSNIPDKAISLTNSQQSVVLRIKDSAYSGYTPADFKTAMSGVYLVYELVTPTSETASPFINPERSYLDGTEEWIEDGTRDVVVPVGNNSEYYQNETYSPVAESSDSVYQKLTDAVAIRPSRVTGFIDDLNNVSSDLNTIFYYTDSNTLNTPYKQGITDAGNQFVINVYGNGNYNTQLAIDIGKAGTYLRRRQAGTWGNWVALKLDV